MEQVCASISQCSSLIEQSNLGKETIFLNVENTSSKQAPGKDAKKGVVMDAQLKKTLS